MASDESRTASGWSLERVVVLVIAPLVLLISIWFAIPGNPFESDAGPLDTLVPADVDAALRGEGIAITEHALVQALGLTPDAVRNVLEEAAAQMPAEHDAERLARDFLSREFVLALRDDEPLLLLRCSGRVRELDLAYEMDQEELDEYRATVLGDVLRVDREDDLSLFVARHRDVLLVSTDEELLRAALAFGDEGAGSLARRAGYANALSTDTPPAGRLTAWIDPELADDVLHGVARTGLVAWAREVLAIDELGPMSIRVQLLPGRARLSLRASWPRNHGRVAPELVSDVAARSLDPVRYASRPGDEAILLDASLGFRANTLLARTLSTLPAEEADGAALDVAAGRIAAHLQDEARLVLTRLPETRAIDVESRSKDAPHALPGVLLEMPLRPGAARARIRAELGRLWRDLAGADASLVADGMLLRPATTPWDDRWRLLTPAAALTGESLVLASNEALLRRVLAASGSRGQRSAGGECTAFGHVQFDHLHAHLVDQRGAAAREILHQDLTGLRGPMTRRVRVKHRDAPLAGDAFERAVDAEVDAYRRRIADVDFPAALEHGRRRWDLLEAFGSAELRVRVEGRELQIDAELRLR